jgi:hypothetical protein
MLAIQKVKIGLRQTAATMNHPIKLTRPPKVSALPVLTKAVLQARSGDRREHAVAKIARPRRSPRLSAWLGAASDLNARRAKTREQNQGYRNTAEVNEAKASQIATHRASDNTITPISCALRRSRGCDRLLPPFPVIGQSPFGAGPGCDEYVNVIALRDHHLSSVKKVSSAPSDRRRGRCGLGTAGRNKWRRGRDSNPRDDSSPSTRSPGMRLRPLGHPSSRPGHTTEAGTAAQ